MAVLQSFSERTRAAARGAQLVSTRAIPTAIELTGTSLRGCLCVPELGSELTSIAMDAVALLGSQAGPSLLKDARASSPRESPMLALSPASSEGSAAAGQAVTVGQAVAVAQRQELEILQRQIAELGGTAAVETVEFENIEQAIERRRSPRRTKAAAPARGTSSKPRRRKAGGKQADRLAAVNGVSSDGKRARPKRKPTKAAPAQAAVPTWQELRSQTLNQDAELSAYLAQAQESARLEQVRMDEEVGTVGRRDTGDIGRQLRGELELMRSLASSR